MTFRDSQANEIVQGPDRKCVFFYFFIFIFGFYSFIFTFMYYRFNWVG